MKKNLYFSCLKKKIYLKCYRKGKGRKILKSTPEKWISNEDKQARLDRKLNELKIS